MVDDNAAGRIAKLLNEFGLRVTSFEERIRILEDKIDALNNTTINQEKDFNENITELRQSVQGMKSILTELKERVNYVINEMPSLVRRDELKIIEKFIKLWQPVKFARIEDVTRIIDEKINGLYKSKKQNN